LLNEIWVIISVKPRIDRSTFKAIVIKAGRAHKWSVDVSGEPPPTISWVWRDNIPLTNTENIKVENVEYHTDFTILNTSRKDSGRYTIVAENQSGKDTETVDLTVLGKHALNDNISYNMIFYSRQTIQTTRTSRGYECSQRRMHSEVEEARRRRWHSH
jgi:hypothetical protein